MPLITIFPEIASVTAAVPVPVVEPVLPVDVPLEDPVPDDPAFEELPLTDELVASVVLGVVEFSLPPPPHATNRVQRYA